VIPSIFRSSFITRWNPNPIRLDEEKEKNHTMNERTSEDEENNLLEDEEDNLLGQIEDSIPLEKHETVENHVQFFHPNYHRAWVSHTSLRECHQH